MVKATSTTRAGFWADRLSFVREQMTPIDKAAWRRFFLAFFVLALSFLLALYSTALSESGRVDFAAWVAGLALLLTAGVAVRIVPYLARRTALERWMVKLEYEFTRAGLIYLLVIAVIAVAALNTGNNLLFMILASLLAAVLVSGIFSRVILSRIELEFALPDHIFAERPTLSRLTILNRKWLFPSFSITVASCDARKREHRQAARLTARQVLSDPVYVPYIPRRSGVSQHVELTFPRRGRYTQDGFRLSSKFPFGLLGKALEIASRQEILALPNVQPTEEFYEILPLIGSETESFSKGRGHDLYAIRAYHESDTARHVDWKATAKTQELKVREFTSEDERRLVLALDTRLPDPDVRRLGQFEKAVTFCACLAWHFYEIEAQMQFVTAGFETTVAPAGEIIYPVLEALALVEPKPHDETDDLLPRIAAAPEGFNIILTCRPRGSIPTSLWSSSYVIFIDSL